MPKRSFEHWVYHIYNRWLLKMNIFLHENDYKYFYKLIIKNISNDKFKNIKIVSFSFLPNHFHFIINITDINIVDPNIISDFFACIQNSYTRYFNKKYERKWQLYEWRFQSKIIQSEKYYHQCISYVALNPLKHWIVDNIDDYKWTSYHQLDKELLNKYKSIELHEFEF